MGKGRSLLDQSFAELRSKMGEEGFWDERKWYEQGRGGHRGRYELNLSSQRLRTFPSWKQTSPPPPTSSGRFAFLPPLKQTTRPSAFPSTGSSGVSRLLGEGQGRPGLKKLALPACKETCCINKILSATGGSVHT